MDETVKMQTLPLERPRRLRTFLRASLGAACLLGGAAASFVLFAVAFPPRYPVREVDVRAGRSPDRVARGKALASVLFCVQCHAEPSTGLLSGRRLGEIPAALSPAAYSANITRHPEKGIGAWSDGQLVYFLRTGIDRQGRLAPPWMPRLPRLADEEILDLVAYLRSDGPAVAATALSPGRGSLSVLGKVLMRYAWRPQAYPSRPIAAPDLADRVAYGRYVVLAKGNCFGCHSASFRTLDETNPERSQGYLGGGNTLRDAGGTVVVSSNLTPDRETGIGRWSETDFIRAVREGIRPDGTPMRGPMQLYKELTGAEVGAVYAYLQTVPPLRRPQPPTTSPVPSATAAEAGPHAEGRRLYVRYGCRSCHGDTGIEIGDLRQADTKYANDAEIEAWIRHPEALKPGTKMPSFDAVIAPDDFAPLIAYVRQLGGSSPKSSRPSSG